MYVCQNILTLSVALWYFCHMENEISGVLKDALRLNPADRAKLIDALYISLESDQIRAIEDAWAREAESRLDAFDAGKIESEPWNSLREKL